MFFSDTTSTRLGMGCWPIGGAMYSGTDSLGYSNAEDGESIRTIHAALDHGIHIFDTAAAYGAGHAERLLAQALNHRPDAQAIARRQPGLGHPLAVDEGPVGAAQILDRDRVVRDRDLAMLTRDVARRNA